MSAATKATIVDAGVGNLGNLERALRHVGAEVELTRDPDVVAASRCLLLPGVGAFRPPRESLRGDLEQALHSALDAGAWLLGICIGYQLLFETSDEFGETDGLALLPGKVNRLPEGVALPHIGWNRVHAAASAQGDAVHPLHDAVHPLLAGIAEASYFYFVHSYAPFQVPQDVRLAETLHGTRFVAVAGRGRVLGTQFHPEKSGPTGLRLLSNYLELCHGSDPSH